MERKSRKRKRNQESFTVDRNDPLYRIFEKHLYDFNYETRENFLNTVIKDYLQELSRNAFVVPANRQNLLESTLMEEVAEMLVRKIYGCLQVMDPHASLEGKRLDTTVEESDKEVLRETKASHISNVNLEAAAAAIGLTPAELRKRLQKTNR